MGFRISKSSMVMLLMLLPLVLVAGVAEPAAHVGMSIAARAELEKHHKMQYYSNPALGM